MGTNLQADSFPYLQNILLIKKINIYTKKMGLVKISKLFSSTNYFLKIMLEFKKSFWIEIA